MKVLRPWLAILVLAASAIFAPASATSYSTDQSDLWWNPAESGWGIQFVHRGDKIFATMFVYDPSHVPIWYGGTLYPTGGSLTWSGDNYVTAGPWFGNVPFDPSQFSSRIVGTMTWAATSISTGTLTYTVDGVSVTKLLTRQPFPPDDFSGIFQGAIHRAAGSCSNPSDNTTSELGAGFFINQVDNTSMTITSSDALGSVCTYLGTLSQAGQMGSVSGTYSCNTGDSGNFNIFELQVNISGITGRFAQNSDFTGCVSNGWFGAMRSAP